RIGPDALGRHRRAAQPDGHSSTPSHAAPRPIPRVRPALTAAPTPRPAASSGHRGRLRRPSARPATVRTYTPSWATTSVSVARITTGSAPGGESAK
ncbi:hypothetical protein ACFOUS_16825, partial [Deinococcus metalli]|uniref:hypothetical protein n=1 Tax=Deinococcus metalli TaxID=1141878 RepID=UPI00361A5BCF